MTARRDSERRRDAIVPLDSSQAQLPLWPDHLRALPWAAIRSALFAPVRPGARAALTREQVAAVGDYRIIYTGLRLDQADLDVFQQVLHQARKTPLGQVVRFNRRDMLRQLGRSQGKSDRDWLLKSLSRLSACEIEVSNGKLSYAGSLIQEQGRDDEAGMHYIVLNSRLANVYDQGWTSIPWERRKLLGRQQLAKWFQAFIAGQRHPLTFAVKDLMKFSDSSYARERDFRKALDEAAAKLRDVGDDTLLQWDGGRGTVTITKQAWQNQGATAIPS